MYYRMCTYIHNFFQSAYTNQITNIYYNQPAACINNCSCMRCMDHNAVYIYYVLRTYFAEDYKRKDYIIYNTITVLLIRLLIRYVLTYSNSDGQEKDAML
jgi:hypothetical protein